MRGLIWLSLGVKPEQVCVKRDCKELKRCGFLMQTMDPEV